MDLLSMMVMMIAHSNDEVQMVDSNNCLPTYLPRKQFHLKRRCLLSKNQLLNPSLLPLKSQLMIVCLVWTPCHNLENYLLKNPLRIHIPDIPCLICK